MLAALKRAKQQIDFRIEKERSDHRHGLSVPQRVWVSGHGSHRQLQRGDAATTRIEDSLEMAKQSSQNSVESWRSLKNGCFLPFRYY
jgi:hypothetical protein